MAVERRWCWGQVRFSAGESWPKTPENNPKEYPLA